MERLLELAQRESQQCEVFEVRSESTLVHFEANRLKQVETKQSHSVAVRLVRDGRIGFASASGEYSPERLIEMAVETSSFGAPARLTFPGTRQTLAVKLYDERVASLEVASMIEMGSGVIESVVGRYKDVQCEGMVSRSTGSVHIINSNRLDDSFRQTGLGLFMEGMRVKDTDMLFVGDGVASCDLFLQADVIAESLLRQLELASRSATITTGSYPVLFTPLGVGAALMGPLAVAFNGKNVVEKASRLAGRAGEELFDVRLSLRDDATLDGRPTSAPFDDEGTQCRRIDLIQNGVVGDFLYDLQTAAEAGVESTGSGHRGDARSQVRPGKSAFVLEEGDTSYHEMLSGIDEGLVVEELIGANQGNLLAGDFGGNVLLGYKVEKGEIVGRVKDTMVAGNIMDVLKKVPAIGTDGRWVGGGLRTPSLLCDGVSVSAKRGEA
ncbi:MAG: TldD/PmbA family protein [Dehalococcoidia bacterium]|nr:TldD/PmbA family protein [Dehalococcoidia bacterium]